MNSESKQPENSIVKKENAIPNLHMKQDSNINIHDNSFLEKDDSISKDNKRKGNSSQQTSIITNKLSFEKENNNEIINNNISLNNEPKNTDINDINTNNNGDIIQDDSTQGSIQIKENKYNLFNNHLKNKYLYIRIEHSPTYNIIMELIELIIFGLDIAIFIFIIRIYKRTDENPLENFDTNNNNNINIEPTINITNQLIIEMSQCQCGEIVINNSCTEEQILSECIDISLNSDKNLLRSLDDDCNDLNGRVKENGGKMHRSFHLRLNIAHKMALGIIIIYCLKFGITVLIIFISFGQICCGIYFHVVLIPLSLTILLVYYFSGIVILILEIIMLVSFYKGYTTGEFLYYYNECMKNEQKFNFYSIYEDLHKLHNIFTVFIILMSIKLFLDFIKFCYDCFKPKCR